MTWAVVEGVDAVFTVVVSWGLAGVLKSVGLIDEVASLNALNKGTKSLFLAIVSLEYVGEKGVHPSGFP